MVTTQDRIKKYVDAHRLDCHFSISGRVFLRVHLRKSPIYYGKGSNLAPCFVGLFEILKRIIPISYRLALPPSLLCIHVVFHVFFLGQYILDVSHIVDWDAL